MKKKIISTTVASILFLSSVMVMADSATMSDEIETSQVVPNVIKIWEAYAKGWVTIRSENDQYGSPTVFRVTNTGNFNVSINEMVMLLSPHPLQTGNPQTTQDGTLTSALVSPNSYVDFYYGEYTLPGWLFEGEKPWWCTEANQYTQAFAPIVLGGEILPFALEDIISSPDAQTNTKVWNYLWGHPTLVVGKTPLWKKFPDATNEQINVTIAVTNIAPYISNGSYIPHARNSLIVDTVPADYSVDMATFDPEPDVIIVNPDGSKTIRWTVDVDAADVTYHSTEDPTPYHTIFLNYTIVSPWLKVGRYFLDRAQADVDRDGTNDAHSARPLLEVYRVNRPPVPDAGGPYEVNEGSDTLLNASGSVDPNGDMITYRWDLDADGSWDTGWSFNPTYMITCPDGPYETDIIVEVTDGELSDSATTNYRCNNVQPTIDSISVQAPSPMFEGDSLSVYVTFTDPGWLDTHTAIIDWRDGVVTSPTVIEENNRPNATGDFIDSHVYGDDFNLGFQITVVDDDGDSDVLDIPLEVLNLDPVIDELTYSLRALEPRTVGYWKHQCGIADPHGDHVGITDEMIRFIKTHSEVFRDLDTKQDVCIILEWASGGEMLTRALGQLMALWLNTASGKLSLSTEVGLPGQSITTLGDILAWAESIILGVSNRSQLEEVKTVCDDINNGKYIPLDDLYIFATIHDPGSDDIIFSADWGDGSSDSETFYNDGLAPDPPNSPQGNYPFHLPITAHHSYWAEGTYDVVMTISDDDGGTISYSLTVNIFRF